jgi:hypothetical protein
VNGENWDEPKFLPLFKAAERPALREGMVRGYLVAALLFAATGVRADRASERVAEPVFGGHVMLYRAGPADAEPVVLIHGLGQELAPRIRDKLIPALSSRYQVLALDLPGLRGQSDKGNELYSPVNFAA